MSTDVYENILAYQNNDSTAALRLIQKFTPLLKHYAYKLYREDAFEDLQCYFLSLLKNIRWNNLSSFEDGTITKYICTSIQHKYIALSKSKSKDNTIDFIDDLNPFATAEYNNRSSQIDQYESLLLQDMKTLLTSTEYNILVAIYFNQCSVSEIAERMDKTRQAVNQTKNNALHKLKRAWG